MHWRVCGVVAICMPRRQDTRQCRLWVLSLTLYGVGSIVAGGTTGRTCVAARRGRAIWAAFALTYGNGSSRTRGS